jgi:hypothetical protein
MNETHKFKFKENKEGLMKKAGKLCPESRKRKNGIVLMSREELQKEGECIGQTSNWKGVKTSLN